MIPEHLIEAAATILNSEVGRGPWEELPPAAQDRWRQVARASLVAADKAAMVRSVEELDALPDGSVVMTRYGDAITIRESVRGTKGDAYHFVLSDPDDFATVLHYGNGAAL
ncbi:hypothetical protein GCM10023081_47040 [Arthrobacter ginkgonis]|uniref:Head-to-tail adaptor n=1 Tax=Arthrobacter ginkgonis TaxID=1630594 RepID=A0ABP7DL83_9MICC